MRDMTLRAIEVLKQVDVIAAEDTRLTVRLLDEHGITGRRLIALHEHNEQRTAPRVIALLAEGRSVALVSDAGTPAFSDPGARLVAAVREAGFRVVPIPGANAAAAALSASGFVGPQFLFYGFLPSKSGERRKALAELELLRYTLVFYEAPHRVVEAIRDLVQVLGVARRIVIARELTKLFETIHACPLGEAAEWLEADALRQKGEFVLMVECAPEGSDAADADAKRTLQVLLDVLPVSQAAAVAAKLTGGRKNELYAMALEMRKNEPGAPGADDDG
jgi:16S rRNA (cytidine1402-2'-O)-methyltransferase